MKYWLVPLISLFYVGLVLAQQEFSSVEIDNPDSKSVKIYFNGEPGEQRFISSQISFTPGFDYSAFDDTISVSMGHDAYDIEINTDYSRALQYTVSDMEGIILGQGRFYREKSIDFTRHREGKYAVYIFASTLVVKAFTVDIYRSAQRVF